MSKIRSLLGSRFESSLGNLSSELRRKNYLSEDVFEWQDYDIEMVMNAGAGIATTAVFTITSSKARYLKIGRLVFLSAAIKGDLTVSVVSNIRFTIPFTGYGPPGADVGAALIEGQAGTTIISDIAEVPGRWWIPFNANWIAVARTDSTDWSIGTDKSIMLNIVYECA